MEGIIEAINQLNDSITPQASVNFSEWALVIVTAVYVILTGVLCYFHYRSTKEMKYTQQQNVRLQLFDMRYNIHRYLSKWFNTAKAVFTTFVLNPEVRIQYRIEVFNLKVFRTDKRLDMVQCFEDIKTIEQFINDSILAEETGELSEDEIRKLLQERKIKQDQLKDIQKDLSSYRKATSRYLDEFFEIELFEYIYEDLDFEKIANFIKAFDDMFLQSTTENLLLLENAFNAIDTEATLQKMKEQIKVLEVCNTDIHRRKIRKRGA